MLREHKEASRDCPDWLIPSLQYEVMMGSHAYGCHHKESDFDVYGFSIPSVEMTFPHLTGYIPGFGNKPQWFEQFNKNYEDVDFQIYNIVKYFHLCMDCNPNMIDSLFVPDHCVLFCSEIGKMVRDNRHKFLSKRAWPKFKGYSYSQMKKMKSKNPVGKRKETVEKYGYDVKFAYHVVRLLDEVEQILSIGDIDVQRDRERLKDIRAGNWSLERIEDFFKSKEKGLEALYETSELPYSPREDEIKTLLLCCLEQHYGSIDNILNTNEKFTTLIQELQSILTRYRG